MEPPEPLPRSRASSFAKLEEVQRPQSPQPLPRSRAGSFAKLPEMHRPRSPSQGPQPLPRSRASSFAKLEEVQRPQSPQPLPRSRASSFAKLPDVVKPTQPPVVTGFTFERSDEDDADRHELGLKILQLATYINRQSEQEVMSVRELIKRSRRSRTPRGDRSGTFCPVPPIRARARSPRPSLPALDQDSSYSSEAEDEEERKLLTPADLKKDEPNEEEERGLRILEVSRLARDQEARDAFLQREHVKRGGSRSKTPRVLPSAPPAIPPRHKSKTPRIFAPSIDSPLEPRENDVLSSADSDSDSADSNNGSLRLQVERAIGHTLDGFELVSSSIFTVNLYQTSGGLLQVTLVEANGETNVISCVKISSNIHKLDK